MGVVIDKPSDCIRCKRSFNEVNYHSKLMCRNCYNAEWLKNRDLMIDKTKSKNCSQCLCLFGSINKKGKPLLPGPKGLCKTCYGRYYKKTASLNCKRCGRDMGKKIKGYCSICKVELDDIKPAGRKLLPQTDKIKIDIDTKEKMRKIFNRYKFGLNTLVDPFILVDLYLTVFSTEATKGQTASKTEFNLDQFDEQEQVIAMLKLLKRVYDKA
jgi:hypothetical protein